MSEEKNWVEEYKNFNKDLEARILEANNDESLVKWSKLLPDLMGAEVFMAGQFDKEITAPTGEKMMNILMLQKNGKMIVPFFTSPGRLSVLVNPQNNEFDVMKVNVVRFFESVKSIPVVLNPMSSYSRVFSPFDMKILAAEYSDKKPTVPDDFKEVAPRKDKAAE